MLGKLKDEGSASFVGCLTEEINAAIDDRKRIAFYKSLSLFFVIHTSQRGATKIEFNDIIKTDITTLDMDVIVSRNSCTPPTCTHSRWRKNTTFTPSVFP